MYLKKGYRHILNIQKEDIDWFSKVLLNIINTKSSNNSEAKIYDVTTRYGENTIIIISEANLVEWLSDFGQVQIEEELLCIIDNDVIDEIIGNGQILIEGKELLNENDNPYMYHIIANNQFKGV